MQRALRDAGLDAEYADAVGMRPLEPGGPLSVRGVDPSAARRIIREALGPWTVGEPVISAPPWLDDGIDLAGPSSTGLVPSTISRHP